MKKQAVTLGFALVALCAWTGSAAPPAPVDPVAAVACPAGPPEDLLGLGTPAATPMSCAGDCYTELLSCLDDCDAWPYPGCYNDCRAARLVCVQACF